MEHTGAHIISIHFCSVSALALIAFYVMMIMWQNDNSHVVFARFHALKYQSISLPNGIIAAMFGPVEGRHHDRCIYHDL